jgi:hypothetical protein
MDKDFKKYSEKTEKQLDKLGISYVYRDSCVDVLVELKSCMKNDFLSYFYILDSLSVCKGIQNLWKDCEYNRETELLNKYFTYYESKQNDLLKKKI